MSDRRAQVCNAIRSALGSGRSLKARELASAIAASGLGTVERRDVNSVLYGELANEVVQDGQYRWRLRQPEDGASPPAPDRGSLLRAVTRLRSGLPPVELIRNVTVGLHGFGPLLLEALSENPPSRWLWVAGNYGEGKSHILALARELALEQQMAVCYLTADSASAALNYPQRFLPLLMSTLELPGRPEHGLDQLMHVLLRDEAGLSRLRPIIERTLHRGRVVDVETRWQLARISDMLSGPGDPLAVDESIRAIVAHLSGATSSHRSGPGARELVYTLLRLVAELVGAMDCSGLVILLDEVESLYTKLPNPQAQLAARRVLAALCESPELQPVRVVMSITPDALRALHRDLPEMRVDSSSVAAECTARWAEKIEVASKIECRPFSKREREQLLERVRELYESTYGQQKAGPEWLRIEKQAASPALPMRAFVRLAVDSLDVTRLVGA